MFIRYYERYEGAKTAYDEQPFLDDRETREERLSFIRDLGVTYVLVRDPDVSTVRYDDGAWALYEVAPAYRAPWL